MIPTTADMLQWIQDRLDDFTQPVRLSGRDMPDFMKREFETIKAIRALISRAGDVDRLVEAAKEATTIIHAKTADDQTEYKIAGAEIKLRAALVPFKEKP